MRKSVLFIVQNLPLPQDRRVWMEARIMKRHGFDVSVISPRNPDQKKYEAISGIGIYRYRKPPKAKGYSSYLWEYGYSFLCTLFLALKIFAKKRFAVIHTANPPDFFFILALLFKPLGVKFIYDQHDLMPEMFLSRFKKKESHPLYKVLRLLESLSCRLANVHIATCLSGQEKTLGRVRMKTPSVIVRSAPERSGIKGRLINTHLQQMISKKFVHRCCYIGVMGPQDGIDKLLNSIAHIIHQKKRTDIGFILMGDGDDFDRLTALAKEMKIDGQVMFTGWANNKMTATVLDICQVGLMPEPVNEYTDNSLHNKVLEYMAAGLPLVCYDLKEARRSADRAALYARNNDEREFAKHILTLIDNPTSAKEMGKFGRRRVDKLFSPKNSEKELKKAYGYLFPDVFPIDIKTL